MKIDEIDNIINFQQKKKENQRKIQRDILNTVHNIMTNFKLTRKPISIMGRVSNDKNMCYFKNNKTGGYRLICSGFAPH